MVKKRFQKDKEKEKDKLKDGEPKGISGLLNLGNSCYLNSILQCLLHLPEIIVYMNSSKLKEDLEYNKNINQLLSEKEKEKQELYYKLVYEFEKLLKQIWEGYSLNDLAKIIKKNNQNDSDEISYKNYSSTNTKFFLEPREFKKILSEIFPQFQGYLQQDAHEVLTDILDSFHLALNKSFNEGGLLISSSLFDSNLLNRKTQSFIADASHKAVNDSFIEDTFFGQLSSIFTCHKCHKKLNETYEPFSSLELTIPIEKRINLFILPLNPNSKEQIKLNININNNMSYEDLYQQMSKITGYTFNNYVIYWINEIKNKNGNKKSRNLRSCNYSNNKYSLKSQLFALYEHNDISINEYNLDKCQNFINSKSNDLIIMENYGNDEDAYSYDIYEYNIELKIMNNFKKINNSTNKQDNLPRIFHAYFLKKEDDHLVFNNIYQYLESFTEKEKTKRKINKFQDNNIFHNLIDFPSTKNKDKAKKTKDVNKLFFEEIRSFCKKNITGDNNNNYIQLEEENEISFEKNYILGIVCKNVSIENNINCQELVCPLCNKKSKKTDDYCECFCINEYFDVELKLKTKEYKKALTNQLINFIEQEQFSHNSLLTIIIHPYSNFSFQMLNKFSMYTVTTNISKSKKKLPHQQNLLELFESFVAEEKIENFYTCDNCGDINYTYQKKDIHKFPQILIIHIKRFKNEIEKNEEKIEFPEDIDLSKYNNKGNIGKYNLNSVVFHQGTLVSGHYTAIFKYLPTNQWLFCNDTKIKFLKGVKIMGLNPSYNKDDISSVGDGYILFYRKDD